MVVQLANQVCLCSPHVLLLFKRLSDRVRRSAVKENVDAGCPSICFVNLGVRTKLYESLTETKDAHSSFLERVWRR